MNFELSETQQALQQQAREFCQQWVSPEQARDYDKNQRLPSEVINALAQTKLLGSLTPEQYGGQGHDLIGFGILNEELGKACSSVRSLLTVHSMVQYAINTWGNSKQKERWLPNLASGSRIGAFALSEPETGSDAANVQSTMTRDGSDYILNGHKQWISFGQIANQFLSFAQINGKPIAFIIDLDTPGLSTAPIDGMLGCRASMLAHIYFKDCRVPKENILGGPGFGFTAIALSALEMGRYSVATGCVGIAAACIEVCKAYVGQREQFGQPIKDFQLIRRHLTEMDTQTKAARLLCHHAAWLKEQDHPTAVKEIMRAKYYAGIAANDVTRTAIQILGARGYSDQYPLERYFRDAKAMEIIEGSNEVLQLVLGEEA